MKKKHAQQQRQRRQQRQQRMKKKAAEKEAMKKKAMKKVSKIAKGKGARAAVFRGSMEKTQGGLTKDSLMKNKRGKIVSKKLSDIGNINYENISPWTKALLLARKNYFDDPKFIPCGGQTDEGKRLLAYTLFYLQHHERTAKG
jgi:hypothetical protein